MVSEEGRNPARRGTLLIVCGPSGAGKSTLCNKLVEDEQFLEFSVSYTTRPARPNEVDGVDYLFVDPAEFERLAADGTFAEQADVHGHRYGSARHAVIDAIESGRDVIFDIDYQGAQQLRAAFADATSVMVLPPSFEHLESRLRARRTDSDEVIARRLRAARNEIEQFQHFNYVVVNSDLDQAYGDLKAIYRAMSLQREQMKAQVWQILS